MLTGQQLQDQQQIKPGELHIIVGNLFRHAINVWASFFYAFTRHSFGCRYYSGRAFLAVFLLFAWESIMAPHADPALHMLVGGLFFIVAICHQGKAHRNKGHIVHSHFNGMSRLTGKLGISLNAAKGFFEPLLVGVAGAALLQLDFSLGLFFIIGGVCCMLDDAAIRDCNREKARRMRDAELESHEVWDTYDELYKN